jgi:hypothetical protein
MAGSASRQTLVGESEHDCVGEPRIGFQLIEQECTGAVGAHACCRVVVPESRVPGRLRRRREQRRLGSHDDARDRFGGGEADVDGAVPCRQPKQRQQFGQRRRIAHDTERHDAPPRVPGYLRPNGGVYRNAKQFDRLFAVCRQRFDGANRHATRDVRDFGRDFGDGRALPVCLCHARTDRRQGGAPEWLDRTSCR